MAASGTLFQQSLIRFNWTLDSDLFCWYKQRKWFLWTLAQAADKHGDEWGLTWYLWFGIYTFKSWSNNQSFDIDWRWFSFLRQIFFTIRHNNWKLIIGKTKEMFEISCSSFFWLSLAFFLLYYVLNWIIFKSEDQICRIFFTFCLIVLKTISRFDISSKLNPLTKFSSSSRSIKFKISCYGTSLKWSPKPSQWRESNCRTNTSVKR